VVYVFGWQAKLSTLEYKLAQACTDVGDLQCKVREYEQLIEEYRSQVNSQDMLNFIPAVYFIDSFVLVAEMYVSIDN